MGPGFYASAIVRRNTPYFDGFNSGQLPGSIVPFMDRVLASDLLTEPQKQNRITVCLRAMKVDSSLLLCSFEQALQNLSSGVFRNIDFVRLAVEQLHRDDPPAELRMKDFAQSIVTIALNRAHFDNDAWANIVPHTLKVFHAEYQWNGQNARLCNLIYLVNQLIAYQMENSNQFERGRIWHNVLVEAQQFDVQATALELQNEFRALRGELSEMTRAGTVQSSRIRHANVHMVLSLLTTTYARLVPS
ncbi:hypothetical protein EDB86DRAFT_2829813 [Lactarius hatsudake]|nr:hypothetical protein EDB86DRAFT_2829813 [Lactarius hatsudake]